MSAFKKVLTVAFSMALLVLAVACKPTPFGRIGDFEPENNKLYVKYLYVSYSGEDGFADDGENLFVYYPGANKKFHKFSTVRVVFYGRNFRTEDTKIKITNEYGTYKKVYTHVITKVKNARHSRSELGEPQYGKPIIYLYPETETVCSVALDIEGELTCSYPEYGAEGWRDFVARPDGTLVFPDGSEYYALYWEGLSSEDWFDMSSGFCVKGSDTARFLTETLPKLGLSAREANEFIIYWLPILQDNAYNLISFQTGTYAEHVKLTISPEPDTVIRLLMTYMPLDHEVNIPPQLLTAPERTGFTVVEWGGSEVKR